MLGFVTGDIVGSPYRQNNTFDENFGLFETVVREFYRKRERDWTRLETEVSVTKNIVPALSVMRWYLYSPEHSVEDLVKEFTEGVFDTSKMTYGPDRNALAFLPLGLCAKDEEELVALQAVVVEALDRAAAMTKGLVPSSDTFTLSGEDAAQACLLSEAVFKVRNGESKDLLRLWASGLFEGSLGASESQMREGSVKKGDVQGLRELNYSILKSNTKDNSLGRSFHAALYSFLYTDNFEKGLRKAVSLGGCSTTVAGIYGALGQIAYGAVPPQIAAQAEQFLDSDVHKVISSFERKFMVQGHYVGALETVEDQGREEFEKKATEEGKSYVKERTFHKVSDNIIRSVERADLSPVYFVSHDDSAALKALHDKGVKDEFIREPEELDSVYRELMPDLPGGTYVMRSPRPEIRSLYVADGKVMSVSGTTDKAVRTDASIRKRVRYVFNEFRESVLKLNESMQNDFGIRNPLPIHFETAAYAEVGKDCVTVYKGQNSAGEDNVLGRVRIDTKTGLIRLDKENDGLENYQVGIFDNISGDLIMPVEVFGANSRDRALVAQQYSDPEDRTEHLEAIIESRRKEMRRIEKYYNIQPLRDVYQCIEDTVNDITTALDARMDRERMDRNTGSPYDYAGRVTNVDLMNQDLLTTEDPELQGIMVHGIKR